MTLETKGLLLGLTVSFGLLGATLGLAHSLQPKPTLASKPVSSAQIMSANTPLADVAQPGHNLFERNCAHCHGDDARGDEGPSLYNLTKSDTRLTNIIKNGIKGEMPKFAAKFDDAEIHALIAYLRTLKD